jgi:hypothetical protein
MPITLGILAQSRQAVFTGEFVLLETALVGSSGAASVTFSNLAQYASSFKHLQIRYTARGTASITNRELRLRLNGDDGSNYSAHTLSSYSDGTLGIRAEGLANTSYARVGAIPAASLGANIFGSGVIDILDAFVGGKNPTVRTLYGFMGGTSSFSQEVGLTSGSRRNTASATSINIFPQTGDLAQHSRFSLYGIRG